MNLKEQIAFLEARLRDNPKSLVFARLADLYLDQNRIDDAVRLCTAGVKHNPSYVTGSYVLAKGYILSQDYENAESALKQVISHDREFLAAHKLLGDLMRKLGWENKAVLHYRDILRIDPLEEKVRSILSSLDAPAAETAEEETVPEWTEEPTEESEPVRSDVLDWMDEIKEVFPDEIHPAPEEPDLEPNTQSAAESVEPEQEQETEPQPAPTESEADESPEEVSGELEETASQGSEPSEEEGPAISETPEFFSIQKDEMEPSGESGPTEEEITARFLSPEQLADQESSQPGESVMPDEVEISEVTEPVPENADEESEDDQEPPIVLETGQDEDDGSDFAQALDALEAMDEAPEQTPAAGEETEAAERPDETVRFDETAATEERESEESTADLSETGSEPKPSEDEPLMHEDSGLPLAEDVGPASPAAEQEPVEEPGSEAGEAAFEWELPEDMLREEGGQETEAPPAREEPEAGPAQTDRKKSPGITVSSNEPEDTESFTLEDLDLDIQVEKDLSDQTEQTGETEQTEQTEESAEQTESSERTSRPERPEEPQAPEKPGVEHSAPEPAAEPAQMESGHKTEDAQETDEEPEEHPTQPAPKIVTPTLGEIYAAQGQFDKAVAVFEELLQQNPDEQRYKDKIAELKRSMENQG